MADKATQQILARLNLGLRKLGYCAKPAQNADKARLAADLDDQDKYELKYTSKDGWEEHLHSTLYGRGDIFNITSPDHEGNAIFGCAHYGADLGCIWMLQSQTFSRCAMEFHGRAWPNKGIALARHTMQVYRQEYESLFNFIPETQKRNIRFLKGAGFEFFRHPDLETAILFFSVGKTGRDVRWNQKLWFDFLGNKNVRLRDSFSFRSEPVMVKPFQYQLLANT